MFLRRKITDETTICWNCSELAEGIVCGSCGVVIRSVLRRRHRRSRKGDWDMPHVFDDGPDD